MHKIAVALAACTGLAVPALAQAPAPAPAAAPPAALDMKTVATSADVQALVAKARATIKPGQPNLNQPILSVAPYRASIEYRIATTPANLHLFDAELVYVISGTGTFTIGGTINESKPPVNGNVFGTTIAGGTDHKLIPGNMFLVPEKVPHWFHDIQGELVLLTLHVPRPVEWPK